MHREHIHFVTGRLAEPSLRRVVGELSAQSGFDYSVDVLNITVAALMTTRWVADRMEVPPGANRVILPGYCQGDLAVVHETAGIVVERGPRDLRRLPQYFGQADAADDYGQHDIEILAEINHCPRLALAEILNQAKQLQADGADLIDVGCDPGETWSQLGDTVRALRNEGHRISVDSLNPVEIEAAVRAGAELVLSVNRSNRHAAADWGCEVVAIPDVPATMEGLDETISLLMKSAVPLRIDPVLEPIGFGFARSLVRYAEIRRRYSETAMMMGIGNLTELTDVDTAGVNVLLLGFCQELDIRSVLTTQVIPWARTSVRECDLGRRLVHYAVHNKVLPKHLEPKLIMLRDPDPMEPKPQEMSDLADAIKDNNFRIFAADGRLHLITASMHWSDSDPFRLMEKVLATRPKNLDAGHAFYLGYEMCKAATALTLGKQYQQDEVLDWGLLTIAEHRHRIKWPATDAEDTAL